MIHVHQITFGYTPTSPLFEGFTWDVARGEMWAILGPSGCGKTTLLMLLAGLRFPTAGQISIEGRPIHRPRPGTGLILQDYGLLPWATVRQNVELGLRIRALYGPDGKHAPKESLTENRAPYWIDRLGLTEVAERYPSQISGGQRQRTAIARTLVLQPDLLLMDEPFSSLDAVTCHDLQHLTLSLCQEQGITLIVVTHAIEEALALGQKILLLGAPPNRQARIFENPRAGQGQIDRRLHNQLWEEMKRQGHSVASP